MTQALTAETIGRPAASAARGSGPSPTSWP